VVDTHHGDFSGVLLCIVDVLSIVPVTSCNIRSLDSDSSAPSCTATTTIRDNVERWSLYALATTIVDELFLVRLRTPVGLVARHGAK